jgi:GNAT superfamily N-acetyltransferase
VTWTTRLAGADDYPVFARLFPELAVPDPVPSADDFARGMVPRVVLACDPSGRALGYAWWQPYGARAHVVHLVVDGRARRSGVGRALLEDVRARALAAGCSRWYLNVKADNAAAIALYERAGFSPEQRSWSTSLAWSALPALPDETGASAFPVAAAEDLGVAARFGIDPGRLALLRTRPGVVLLGLRSAESVVAFASFDPAFPGAYPFRVARPSLARPLLSAMLPHALERFDFVRVVVEDDRALLDALVAAGAGVLFEFVQMGGPLAPAPGE